MAERVLNGYKRLFEVRILHHYWLDDGATVFDLLPTQSQKDTRLLSYDVRPFLAVAPTVGTEKDFGKLGCIFKNTGLGCVVAVPDNTLIPVDSLFEFVIKVQHYTLFNYTALTLRPQKIYEIYYEPEKTTYRYKENVFVFSNLTGTPRGSGTGKSLYLSKEIPALSVDDQIESLIVSGNALFQLTSDQPGAITQQLNAQATNLPVFVNQSDVPVIVPPAGLPGAPERGVSLADDMDDDVFAIIRLSAVRADDNDFSFIEGIGNVKISAPVFQIRFKNRSTVWKYFSKSTGTLLSIEPNPLPLTYFGNAGSKQKPFESLTKAQFEDDDPAKKIQSIFSEIFE